MINHLVKMIKLNNDLINPEWFVRVKLKNLFSRKIKVGFGPITSGENDLAERKWRIDPIINAINSKKKCGYVAGFFIHPEEMKYFDIIVIVKKFTIHDVAIIRQLKQEKKLLVAKGYDRT